MLPFCAALLMWHLVSSLLLASVASASCSAATAPTSASLYSPLSCRWSGYDLTPLASVDLFGSDDSQRMFILHLCGSIAEPTCAASAGVGQSSQLCVWGSSSPLSGSTCSAPLTLQTSNATYAWSVQTGGLLVTAYPSPSLYCTNGASMVTYIHLLCSNSSAAVPSAGLSSVELINGSSACACQTDVTLYTSLVCGNSWLSSSSSSTGGSQPSGSPSSTSSPMSSSAQPPTASRLTVTAIQLTASAAWPSRIQGSVYIVPASSHTSLTLNTSSGLVTALAGPSTLVMYGGIPPATQNVVEFNDVWASVDGGASFSPVVYSNGGYESTYFGPATCVDLRKQILYSIAGSDTTEGDRGGISTIWSSTDLGQTWSSADAGFEGRTNSLCVVDSTSKVYVIAGKQASNTGDRVTNDVWMGTLKATSPTAILTWTLQTATAPFQACDAPMGTSWYSPALGLDVLYKSGGYGYTSYQAHSQDDGVGNNDVWASLDSGLTWTLMAIAQYGPRYHARMMSTTHGLLVVMGGANAPEPYYSGGIQQEAEYDLNDLWVSLDGGYTWGQCTSQLFPLYGNTPVANASDFQAGTGRQDPLLQIDPNSGFLYMGSGLQRDQAGQVQTPHDFYRSSISFYNFSAVAAACGGLTIPTGGTGLLQTPSPLLQINPSNHSDTATCTLDPFGLSLAPLAYDLVWTEADGSTTWVVNLCQPVTSSYMCDMLAEDASVCRYATCNPWSTRNRTNWADLSDFTPPPTWYPTNGLNASAGVEYRSATGQACGNGSLQAVVRLVCNSSASVGFISSVLVDGCTAMVVVQSSLTCGLVISDCPSGCCGLGYDFSLLEYDLYGYDDVVQVWGLHMCGAMSTPQCEGRMLCEQAACHPDTYATYAASVFDPYAMAWSYINGRDHTGGVQFIVNNGAVCNDTGSGYHIGQFVCDPSAVHPSTFAVLVDDSGCTFTTVVHTALVCGPPSLNSSGMLLAEGIPHVAPVTGCHFEGYDFSSLSTYDLYGAADDFLYVTRVCGAISDPQCAVNSAVATSSVCQINTRCGAILPQLEARLSSWNPDLAQWAVVEGGVALIVQDGQQCSTGPSTIQWLLTCDEEAEWGVVTDVVQQSGDGCSFVITVLTNRACPSLFNASLARLQNVTSASMSASSTGLVGQSTTHSGAQAERAWLCGTTVSALAFAATVGAWLLSS